MLEALTVDKKFKPYVHLNIYREPWAIVAPGDKCTHAGYTLVGARDGPSKPKKLKQEADMWS